MDGQLGQNCDCQKLGELFYRKSQMKIFKIEYAHDFHGLFVIVQPSPGHRRQGTKP